MLAEKVLPFDAENKLVLIDSTKPCEVGEVRVTTSDDVWESFKARLLVNKHGTIPFPTESGQRLVEVFIVSARGQVFFACVTKGYRWSDPELERRYELNLLNPYDGEEHPAKLFLQKKSWLKRTSFKEVGRHVSIRVTMNE